MSVAEMDRNGWPFYSGIGGRIGAEWVAGLERNTQPDGKRDAKDPHPLGNRGFVLRFSLFSLDKFVDPPYKGLVSNRTIRIRPCVHLEFVNLCG